MPEAKYFALAALLAAAVVRSSPHGGGGSSCRHIAPVGIACFAEAVAHAAKVATLAIRPQRREANGFRYACETQQKA
jgi:hypothetical protein